MTVASAVDYKNNRLRLEAEAVISFYLRSLKYLYNKSAKAINMLIIINSCVKVMYSILSTSLPCSEGSRNMLPSEKGSNRHRLWCSPDILRYRDYYIIFVAICQP